jgi:hypothetical protein
VDATRREEVVSGLRLDPKIPPLGAKGWGTGESNPSHPSRRLRRVGHPQNLKLNSGMELLAVDQPSVVTRKQGKKGGPPADNIDMAFGLGKLPHAAERLQQVVNDTAPLLTVGDLRRITGKHEREAIASVEDLEVVPAGVTFVRCRA